MNIFKVILYCVVMSSQCFAMPTYLYPAWWAEREVVTADYRDVDYMIEDRSPVNQGQVKWMVEQAYNEFEAMLPDSSPGIADLLAGFTDTGNNDSVNIGQLKNIAKPFYDRMHEYGLVGAYPWNTKYPLIEGSIADAEEIDKYPNDYEIASMGHLKEFFDWELPLMPYYYVATNGNNSALGTINEPFKTIRYAVDNVTNALGGTVIIRGGIYREMLTINHPSATSSGYMTIMGFNTEMPEIRGSRYLTGWVHHTNDIWKLTGKSETHNQVFYNEELLTLIGLPGEYYVDHPDWVNEIPGNETTLSPGTFHHNYDSDTLYVWLPDSSEPPPEGLECSFSYTYPISLTGAPWSRLYRIRATHSGTIHWNSLVASGPHGVLREVDAVLGVFGGMYFNDSSTSVYCNSSWNGNNGGSANENTNILIYGCSFTHNNYLNYSYGWHSGGFKFIPDVQATVENCFVSYNNSYGIWFDDCMSHPKDPGKIVIRNNTCVGNENYGIFVEISTGALVYNNLIYDNVNGICIAETPDSEVYNNTVIGSSGHSGIYGRIGLSRMEGPHAFTNNSFYNNIITSGTSTDDIVLPSDNVMVDVYDTYSDYNIFYREGGAQFSRGADNLAEWQATGIDLHSIDENPLILYPHPYGADLSINSPAIGFATNVLSYYDHDYLGQARVLGGTLDAGCMEFDGLRYQKEPFAWSDTDHVIVPYDDPILKGNINANIEGDMTATISTGTPEPFQISYNLDDYSWSMDTTVLDIGTIYSSVITSTNTTIFGDDYPFTFEKGDIGTGTPTIYITTDEHQSLTEPIILDGTNNIHVIADISWQIVFQGNVINSGTFTHSGTTWQHSFIGFNPGMNDIIVTGINELGATVSDTISIDYTLTENHYVSLDSPLPTSPYITWDTAAHTIQDAVYVAYHGDSVIVSNGIHFTGYIVAAEGDDEIMGATRVALTRGIRLESLNGPEVTTIQGTNTDPWPTPARCIYMEHPDAELVGFTLSDGLAVYRDPARLSGGGGIYIIDFNLVQDCIIENCESYQNGGGIYVKSLASVGTITDVKVRYNEAEISGGGISVMWGDKLTIDGASIHNNTGVSSGGLSLDNNRNSRNLLVYNNTATSSTGVGGVAVGNWSILYNSTIMNNNTPATGHGGVYLASGGAWSKSINNIILDNYPDNVSVNHPEDSHMEYNITDVIPIGLSVDVGNIVGDPNLLPDYTPSTGSIAVDAGTYYSWMATALDVYGNPRINGGIVDIGAVEQTLNQPPSFPVDPFSTEDAAIDFAYSDSLALYVFDVDGDPITFAKVSGPEWLSVASDGTLGGMPVESDLGLNSFVVSATDVDGTTEAALEITVLAYINFSPVFISSIMDYPNAVEGSPYTGQTLAGTATDANDDVISYYSMEGDSWLTINVDGTLSGTPLVDDVGSNSWQIAAFDGTLWDVGTLNIYVEAEVVLTTTEVLTEGVMSRLDVGDTLAVEGELFTSHVVNSSYPRNPDFWASDIDISCTSVYYSYAEPERRKLTMITPRHGVASAHYGWYTEGNTYGFTGMDGVYETRTIQKVITDANRDTTVILLSSDLSSNIKPCKIAPSNWGDYISIDPSYNMANNIRIPTLTLNQHYQGSIHNFYYAAVLTYYTKAEYKLPQDPAQSAMAWDVVDGDSGCPSFFIYNGEPLLVSLWWHNNDGDGPAQPAQIDFLNTQISAVDALAGIPATGYTVTEGDFSQ